MERIILFTAITICLSVIIGCILYGIIYMLQLDSEKKCPS